MPVVNFSEDASQQYKNCLRGNGLSETALPAFSVKCPLALELGAESNVPNGPAFLLKPRRSCHGARGLHCVLPPTFAFPHFVPSAVLWLPCSALNCTAGFISWLKKVFLLLSLSCSFQLVSNYRAMLSLPGTQTKESREFTLRQQMP